MRALWRRIRGLPCEHDFRMATMRCLHCGTTVEEAYLARIAQAAGHPGAQR